MRSPLRRGGRPNMPRKPRTKAAPSFPCLASEAARGDADFEPHLIAGGGLIRAVAVEWGRRERVIADGCASICEAMALARRDEWWRQGGPVEIRSILDGHEWRLDANGCWSEVGSRRAA